MEPEAKLVFVVRIRGLNKIHPKVRGRARATVAAAGPLLSLRRGRCVARRHASQAIEGACMVLVQQKHDSRGATMRWSGCADNAAGST